MNNILEAVGEERDPYKACCLNVIHAVERLKNEFASHPENCKLLTCQHLSQLAESNVR